MVPGIMEYPGQLRHADEFSEELLASYRRMVDRGRYRHAPGPRVVHVDPAVFFIKAQHADVLLVVDLIPQIHLGDVAYSFYRIFHSCLEINILDFNLLLGYDLPGCRRSGRG